MMDNKTKFSPDALAIDPAQETEAIVSAIRKALAGQLKRRGLVVALSGGIDSSVTLALAMRALGKARVLALLMPEKHSAADTMTLSRTVAGALDAPFITEDITPMLKAVGFYQRYNEAVRTIIPAYGQGWRSKIVLPNVLAPKGYNLFSLVAQSPGGETVRQRLPLRAYLEIVAATNFKQRTRKMLEYYHADRLNYAVAGTPNRLEYDQGFFVKGGDGAADIKPIAHLYKSQVYALAAYLDIPREVIARPPTTDTYSLNQDQDEFYFPLPIKPMDLCLFAKNNGVPPDHVAEALGYTEAQIQQVYDDIDAKRTATRYQHLSPLLVQPIPEIKLA